MNRIPRRGASALAMAFCLALPSLAPALDKTPKTYDACLESLVAAMISPLIDAQMHSSKKHISLAAAGFRDVRSGQRWNLSIKIEHDLNAKIKDGTTFKVPSPARLHQVLQDMASDTADFSNAVVLEKFGRLLDVDVVVSGSFLLQGSSVVVKASLLKCSDGSEVWSDSLPFPAIDLQPGGTDLVPNSQLPGFVAPQLPADMGAVSVSPVAEEGNSPTAHAPTALDLKYEREEESTFSWSRISASVGQKNFIPLNATFNSVVGETRGAYFKASWADFITGEFDFWSDPNRVLADIGSIFAYGISFSATAPIRLGPHVILYGGLGGRFESISLGGTTLPSADGVYYGNNSFFGTAGGKLHYGPYGLDLGAAYDFGANYTQYISYQLGIYYEFSL
jgi:TolB-like protein